MADIAERAGVHQTTVSLALRNSPRLSAATRERIQALAQEMGYRKDPYVTALMARVHTGRRREEAPVLAVLDTVGGNVLSEPSFAEILRGFRARAEELGYVMDTIPCAGQPNAIRDVRRHLRGRGIQTAFLPASPGALDIAEKLSETALVSITGNAFRHRIHTTGPDHFHNARIIASRLISRDVSRFVVLVPESWKAPPLYEWLGGLHAELQTALDEGRIRRILPPRLVRAPMGDPAALARLLGRSKTLPEAIIGYPGTFRETLIEAGFSVPDEILFLDPALFAGEKGAAGINPRRFEVGQAAANILTAQLHRHEFGMPPLPRTVLLEGEWIDA